MNRRLLRGGAGYLACILISASLALADAQCDGRPNGTACSDLNVCTLNDTCQGQVCTPGPLDDCDDLDPCTDDSCSGGCLHQGNGPMFLSAIPWDGSEGQSVATNVHAFFSEPLDPATVTTSTFRLLGPGGGPVAASVALDPSGTRATLDPTAALGNLTQYTVEVIGVEDLAGCPQVDDLSTSFWTGTASPGTPLPSVADETSPPPAAAFAKNGTSVAPAGDLNGDGLMDFISGAPNYQVGGNVDAGAAIVYLGSSVAAERRSPDVIFRGEAADDRAGISLAGRFDFNGDGGKDFLIGAWPSNAIRPGKAYLVYFDPTDYPNLSNPTVPDIVNLSDVGTTIPGVVFTGIANGDRAGFSVAGGPRVHAGSGGDDILIGAPGRDLPSKADAGVAYLIFSDPSLPGTVSLSSVANPVAGVVFEGEAAGDLLGSAVAFPGDVMGTVGGDLALGAPDADPNGLLDAGIVYVAQGGAFTTGTISVSLLGPLASPLDGTQFQGSQAGEHLGASVAGGGDNQVDGETDLLMGAPGYDVESLTETTLANAGAAFRSGTRLGRGIIDIDAVGTSGAEGVDGAAWTGEESGDALGTSVAGVGDVTGDGYDDIALGAPQTDPYGVVDAGTTYVVEGAPSEDARQGTISAGTVGNTTAGTALVGTEEDEHAGTSAAGPGDVDGQGTSDIVVGSPERDVASETDAGTDYIVALDDADQDGFVDRDDCNSANGLIWSVPGEVTVSLQHNRTTGVTTASWTPPMPLGSQGAEARTYTVYGGSRSDLPNLLNANPDSCIVAVTSSRTATIPGNPASGGLAWYLVRAANACGEGPAGNATAGPRIQDVRGCDDGIACTTDSCDAASGCVHTPVNASCSDGIACTTDSCDAVSGCLHTPVNASCNDGIACTTDSCNAASGCVHTPVNASCNDGNVCTNDTCNAVSGCVHVNNSASCNDGDHCTMGDVCSGGVCSGTIPGIANHLVISQIQVAGNYIFNPADDEFVEIYNPTSLPKSLNGLSLQYKEAGSYLVHLLPSANIPPHGWFLVAPSSSYDGSVIEDQNNTRFLMSSTGGNVFLVNGTTALSGTCSTSASIIDKVGYGTANCPETTAVAAPAANNSRLRKPDGTCGNGTDTNNNAADFSSQVPSTPRNSSSSPQP